tara:strand:- start:2324 stop:4000 length:1677 start_codon:yes stop_codon:yes gene_type:complete
MGQWRQIPVLWALFMGFCWVGLIVEAVLIRDWPFWVGVMGFFGIILTEVLWRSKLRNKISGTDLNSALVIYLGVFLVTFGIAWVGLWIQWAFASDLNEQGLLIFFSTSSTVALVVCFTFRVEQQQRDWPVWTYWLALTISIYPIWQGLVFGANYLGWVKVRIACAQGGMCLAFISGLLWVVWGVERRSRKLQLQRYAGKQKMLGQVGPLEAMNQSVAIPAIKPWDPFDQDAWYYGKSRQKLKQSFNAIFSYTIIFVCMVMLILSLSGCREVYELPAGGGEEMLKQKIVKIKKVIQKKYVINPYSAILFNPPPIEKIKLQLLELTKHVYKPGHGEGKGAGFAGGTKRGKVRFIRLKYAGGDWDQDLDLHSDLNMLLWYSANTGHETAPKPEVRTINQLKNFPIGKSPPLVYMTGQKSLGSISSKDKEVLREYLTDKHGMLFADNGGSSNWHSQFFSLMRQVLPGVEPIKVPLDHPVHNGMPFLPIVAPHGGRVAYGWVVESRMVAYYHPGDIGDAWADGHAGVPGQIYEACYRLGGNVILYAHAEYSKWLQSRKKEDKK